MKNVIISQLKKSMDNYMLPYYNHIMLNFDCSDAANVSLFRLGANSPISVDVIVASKDETVETQALANTEQLANFWLQLSAQNYNVAIPIGDVTKILFVGTDASNNKKIVYDLDSCVFPLCQNLTHIDVQSNVNELVVGDIEKLKKLTGLKKLNLTRCRVSGRLSDLSPFTELEEVFLQWAELTGNLTDLSGNLKLTKALIDGCTGYNTRDEYLSGVSNLAAAQVQKGRTSGTLYARIDYSHAGVYTPAYINFGTSMVNPTSAETSQGYQIKDGVPS